MIIPLPQQAIVAGRVIPSLIAVAAAYVALQSCCDPRSFLLPSLACWILAYLASQELSHLMSRMGLITQPRWIALTALLPMISCFMSGGQTWAMGLGVLAALALPAAASMRAHHLVSSWVSSCLALVYLGVPFLVFQELIMPRPEYAGMQMRWQIAFFLIAVKGSDIGGLLIGRYLGRRRLAPIISPGKTWEGLVGGLLFADAFCLILTWAAPEGVFVASPSTLSLVALGLALAAQGGDLFESYLKRLAKVKDSGQLPGFGGVLDLLDSPLVAICLFWVFLQANLL